MTVALMVIAKEPVPGRVKTRLTPPCTPEQAATLAQAALVDTLSAVGNTPATRRVCVLDGEPGDWLPEEFEVIPQRGDGLDERLAAAFADVPGPALLVGMDTPQVTPELLHDAARRLLDSMIDAVIGLTDDGGYWIIGLKRSHDDLFVGVPMSRSDTGQLQLERLEQRGLRVSQMSMLRDVDDFDDAGAVAHLAPDSAFAAACRALPELQGSSRS
jgi:rSAM/selenodomain-associated transferase 1